MNFGFSSGLEYRFGKNGTAVLISTGSCRDKHIIVPEFIDGKTVTEIDERAFCHSDKIVSVTLPHTVSKIGKAAFAQVSFHVSKGIGQALLYFCAQLFIELDNVHKLAHHLVPLVFEQLVTTAGSF